MIERLFGGDRFLANTRALDAAALRHQVISNNIANANTPNFKRQEVVFESRLSTALDRLNNPCMTGEPVSAITPQVVSVNTTSTRTDGNNVDMELENVNLAVNELRFTTLAQSVGGYFSKLNMVINGR